MSNKVWYITGASKGLGLVLVKHLLAAGNAVAATSRRLSDLTTELGPQSANFLPLQVDLINEEEVTRSVRTAIDHFGKIDVVVNNAGYGLTGALEELTDKESRLNFDVNVFGSLNVIRQVMPYLRKQGSGHIFNIASIGGFTGGFPGFGIYCATKFAVHGFSESLAAEVSRFGIHVTVVSPGYFRTNFLTSTSLGLPQKQMEEYKEVRESQDLHQQTINGNQPGDPEKAAEVMIAVADQQDPPMHLFLGQDAYNLAIAKMDLVKKDLEKNRSLTISTGFDQ